MSEIAASSLELCVMCGCKNPSLERHNPVHVWARCYACPGCLRSYATDEAAMNVIRPIVVKRENARMARVRRLEAEGTP
jgi:hypothetical protein